MTAATQLQCSGSHSSKNVWAVLVADRGHVRELGAHALQGWTCQAKQPKTAAEEPSAHEAQCQVLKAHAVAWACCPRAGQAWHTRLPAVQRARNHEVHERLPHPRGPVSR